METLYKLARLVSYMGMGGSSERALILCFMSQVSPLLDGSARQWLWDNTRPLAKH